MDVSITGVISYGRIYNYQNVQSVSTTAGSTALSMVHLINGSYQITQTAAVSLPLPTGTTTYSGGFVIDQSVDWSVINTGSSLGAATVQATTAHTLIGSGVVATGTSGRFRNRITAINIAITCRIS